MPGAVRRPDLDTLGFDNVTYSTTVFIENYEAVRYNDSRVHPPPIDGYNCGKTIDGARIMVENRDLQYIGHPNTSGSTQCQGSGTVIGN